MTERYRIKTEKESRAENEINPTRSRQKSRRHGPTMERSAKIGYGSPPKHTRFAPGQSGNPNGRPKGARNLKTIIQGALSEKITVREGDKRRSITKLEGVVLRQIEGALHGNHRSALATLKIAAQVGLLEKAPDAVDELTLTPTEQQIIDELLSRPAGKKRSKRR